MVEVRYDETADALYLTLLRDVPVDHTERINGGTLVDVASDGRVVGIEVIGPASGQGLASALARFNLEADDEVTLRRLFGAPTVS